MTKLLKPSKTLFTNFELQPSILLIQNIGSRTKPYHLLNVWSSACYFSFLCSVSHLQNKDIMYLPYRIILSLNEH